MAGKDRDWDAEEAALRAKVITAFEQLVGIRSACSKVQSRHGEVAAQYVAEEAQETYQQARAELDAFICDRLINDASRRKA